MGTCACNSTHYLIIINLFVMIIIHTWYVSIYNSRIFSVDGSGQGLCTEGVVDGSGQGLCKEDCKVKKIISVT